MSEKELYDSLHKLANSTSIGCDWRAEEHYQAARRWSSVHRWLTLPAAVIGGVAGTAIIADSTAETLVLVAGLVAILVAALTAANGVLTPEERASQHKKGYDGFSSKRTQFLVFRDCTLRLGKAPEILEAELKELLSKRDDLASAVPEPPMWARKKARRVREKRKRSSGPAPAS